MSNQSLEAGRSEGPTPWSGSISELKMWMSWVQRESICFSSVLASPLPSIDWWIQLPVVLGLLIQMLSSYRNSLTDVPSNNPETEMWVSSSNQVDTWNSILGTLLRCSRSQWAKVIRAPGGSRHHGIWNHALNC